MPKVTIVVFGDDINSGLKHLECWVEGCQKGCLLPAIRTPPPEKDLESPSSTRLEALVPSRDSRAMIAPVYLARPNHEGKIMRDSAIKAKGTGIFGVFEGEDE